MSGVALNVLVIEAAEAELRPPLVIAHGLFGSARNFSTLGRHLATDRRVLLVDMRNHGESPWADAVDYVSQGEDLAGVVRTRCGGTATVLGHSMGGKAAMALALGAPDLVRGVIIADIAPIAYTHSHLSIVQAMRGIDLGAVSRRSQAGQALAGAIPDPALRAFILQSLDVADRRARWRLNLAALEAGMPDLLEWPRGLRDARYTGPALSIYGGRSDYMTDLLKPRMRESFANITFSVVPDAGHWLHAEQPAAFLNAVKTWLAAQG